VSEPATEQVLIGEAGPEVAIGLTAVGSATVTHADGSTDDEPTTTEGEVA
jgi:hypothetical protein